MDILGILLGLVAIAVAAFAFVIGESRHSRQKAQYSELKRQIDEKLPDRAVVDTIPASEAVSDQRVDDEPEQDVSENYSDDEIPEGAKFIVQGIPYPSYAQCARDMSCDSAYLRDCIVFKPGNRWGTTFEKFMENRTNPNNIEKFKESRHYKKVIQKYGSYPPPQDVELLVICDEQPLGSSKSSSASPSHSASINSEEYPEGTKFVVQGIPYQSKAEIADSMDCDRVHLGDAINYKEGSQWGMPFKQFMDNREKPRSKERFTKSDHYRRVVEKFGTYPPPEEVPLLVILD